MGERAGRTLRLGRERQPRPRRRLGYAVSCPGRGAATLAKRLGTEISMPTIVMLRRLGPLGKRPRDVERHVGGRGENVVGDELRVLASQANGAGKAGGRIEPHFAGGADRTGVRRCSCEMVDPDRASVRDECPGHAGKLKSC